MTIEQVQWAKDHDWYVRSYANGLHIFGVEQHTVVARAQGSKVTRYFESMTTLYKWAGY